MSKTEIQGLLASAIRKLSDKPSTMIDVIATPASASMQAAEALARHVEHSGGKSMQTKPESVHLRLPVSEVECLASTGLASSLRMARLAKMH